ncbi:hypothetical protein [Wohlfahrtiimonas populi]|uniref:hypothetical protein n=1 Tax=Wohlfahrtiimonas populi TaxID=1940240 RepID=UPI00098D59D6|nr:hypothetical protein [Wohlfahrtiimonas populi]
MTDKDNEFESFMDDNFEDFYNNLPKKIWADINNLTTLPNVINHDYIEFDKIEECIHIDSLIRKLIINNYALFPNQNQCEWDELIYEFKKLLGATATEEEQFKLGINPDEIKFIRSCLQEKITPNTPFQYWECNYQFKQSLYNALINVWKLIIDAISPFQINNIDLSNSVLLDKIATRADFREIIKKRPMLYFYIDKSLKVSKKKIKLFPNCKLTFTARDNNFYEISPEDVLISNDYKIDYTEQSIQVNSVFLNNIALTDISNRQIIVPTNENIEYLKGNLKDIQSYLTLPIEYFNISLHFNQAYISNEQLTKLGINKPKKQSKPEKRNAALMQLIKEDPSLIDTDGITCTMTQEELWEKCIEFDRKLFASGKDDFFNKAKNPNLSEIINFSLHTRKK